MDDARAGRTAPPYRSKAWLVLGPFAVALASGAACSSPAPRLVTVHTPVGCAAPAVNATYTATGDFPPPAPEVAPLSGIGLPLTALPPYTRSMLVEVVGWTGVSLVDPDGPVDVLALPFQKICPLPDQVSPPAADTDPGQTMGLIDAQHALLVGGSGSAPLASVIDLGTGAIALASPGLLLPRNDASVTAFGSGALVAGGMNPDTHLPRDTAEVYESPAAGGVGGFTTQEALPLASTRAKHGAVVLLGGETLLIGGTSDGTHALRSLEYIAPGAHKSTTLGVGLRTARISPTVLRLPTGKIFVAGGFDDSGKPVGSVEWLDADLSLLESNGALPPVQLCPHSSVVPAYAFAPLEGGAVLAVPPATPTIAGCSTALIIRADYNVDVAQPPSPPPSEPFFLVAGAASSPVLITGAMVQQWNPWTGGWSSLLDTGPILSKPRVMLSADPGLALWVADDSFVHALRFSTRNAWVTDREQLVSDGSQFAPDRLVGADVSFVNNEGLVLRNGASAFLTDATFADFSIDFTATGPVELVLRDDDTGALFPFLESTCLPLLGKATNVEVVRKGSIVSAGAGGQLGPCMTGLLASERVAVGFQAPASGMATVTAVSIQRTGTPH